MVKIGFSILVLFLSFQTVTAQSSFFDQSENEDEIFGSN
jgi:hypothetical protein